MLNKFSFECHNGIKNNTNMYIKKIKLDCTFILYQGQYLYNLSLEKRSSLFHR